MSYGLAVERSDLDQLQRDYPRWRFGTTWATVNTGPDVRRLTATRDGILLSAWTAAELAHEIRREEGMPYAGGCPQPLP